MASIEMQTKVLEDGAARESKRTHGLKLEILSAAFSGELVLQDPTDEPASVLLGRIAAERAKTLKHTAPAKGRRKKVTS